MTSRELVRKVEESKMAVHTPAPYLERGVIYQINPRAFTNEGTLSAAAEMLPHLADIGVDIVYLCPIFTADPDERDEFWSPRTKASKLNNPKNPYRISDYYSIDPEYGTIDDLTDFTARAHENGMRVILDLVYYHCGPNAVFIADHPNWIKRLPDGTPDVGEWHYPKLNYDDPELCEYMARNMEFFVEKCDVDGYRCDVGDMVPIDFWRMGTERIRKIKPDVMMLNEGTRPEHLRVFDLNYGWYLRDLFTGCVIDGKPVSTFADGQRSFSERNLQGTYQSMVLLENHDSVNDDYDNRLEKRVGKKAFDAGLVVNYTLPNVPFIYNGTEVCDTNRHSIWGNRFHGANLTIDWQNALTEDGKDRMRLMRELSGLRHSVPALGMQASLEFGKADNEHVLVYTREFDGTKVAVIVNFSDKPVRTVTDIESTDVDPMMMRGAAVAVSGTEGKLSVVLDGYGFAIVGLV